MSKTLLLIIPCFNESSRININTFIDFAEKHSEIDLLFIDDGSTDNTAEILENLSERSSNIYFKSLKSNLGKGNAIREGMISESPSSNSYEYYGYLDADLAVPLDELFKIFEFALNNPKFKFFMGSRVARLGADIKRNILRHYIGRFFASSVSYMLQEVVYDTQCGAKIIQQSLAKKIFQEQFETKWLFDIELIARCKQHYSDCEDVFYEYPIAVWHEIEGSKLKFKHFVLAPLQILKIWIKYRKYLTK